MVRHQVQGYLKPTKPNFRSNVRRKVNLHHNSRLHLRGLTLFGFPIGTKERNERKIEPRQRAQLEREDRHSPDPDPSSLGCLLFLSAFARHRHTPTQSDHNRKHETIWCSRFHSTRRRREWANWATSHSVLSAGEGCSAGIHGTVVPALSEHGANP